MMKTKKVIAGALAAATLLSSSALLTGCGKKGSSDGPEYVYVPTYITVNGDFSNGVNSLCFSGDKFYFLTYPGGGEAVYSDTSAESAAVATAAAVTGTDISGTAAAPTLYSLDLQGKTQKLADLSMSKLPQGKEGSVNIVDFDANDKGGFCTVEEMYTYHFEIPAGKTVTGDEKYNYQTMDGDTFKLNIADASGKTTASVDLSSIGGDNAYVNDIKYGSDGNIYLAMNQTAAVLDGAGKLLYKKDLAGYLSGIVKLADGRMAAAVYAGDAKSSNSLQVFDNAGKTLTQLCTMPTGSDSLFSGGGEYGACYTSGAYLYGINTSSGTSSKILNWISSDINSDEIIGSALTADGKVACVTSTWDNSTQKSSLELAVLTKTKASSIDKKKVITMACQYLDYSIKGEIIKFNKTNPDYRIEVKDYSEYNTDDDYTAGTKKMNTEILSGDVPDIIYMNGLNQEQYVAKGLLEDLTPYMDKDSEVKTSSIMDNVLKAMQIDGKIYTTCSSFGIQTVIGPSSLVGDKPGWTVDQLLAAYKKMPAGATIFDQGTTRADILNSCLSMDMDDYVNWTTKECKFDSDGFKKLLEFSKSFPETFDWDKYYAENPNANTTPEQMVAAGKQMLIRTSLYDFQSYQYSMLSFSGKATCIGYPTSNGVGNVLTLSPGFSISANCSDKDGAWQFVRTFMTAKYQQNSYNGYPTNKTAFDKMLKDAMTPQYQQDENGKYVLDAKGNKIELPRGGMSAENGQSINFYALKQSEADALMSIINSTTKHQVADDSITQIINDESAAFFSGSKSADETAKLVQSRVSIYVNEQS
jgi:ABC-type glycerol-3-phosphate transport system substrate-binding protein